MKILWEDMPIAAPNIELVNCLFGRLPPNDILWAFRLVKLEEEWILEGLVNETWREDEVLGKYRTVNLGKQFAKNWLNQRLAEEKE